MEAARRGFRSPLKVLTANGRGWIMKEQSEPKWN